MAFEANSALASIAAHFVLFVCRQVGLVEVVRGAVEAQMIDTQLAAAVAGLPAAAVVLVAPSVTQQGLLKLAPHLRKSLAPPGNVLVLLEAAVAGQAAEMKGHPSATVLHPHLVAAQRHHGPYRVRYQPQENESAHHHAPPHLVAHPAIW